MDKYRELLTGSGVVLRALGIQDIALRREDALCAVRLVREASMPILGGDVYLARGGRIEVGYANWYTDRAHEEAWSAFVDRSCGHAEKYIQEFPDREGVDPLFVLVIMDEDAIERDVSP